jgi:type IV secretion system protein TrbL
MEVRVKARIALLAVAIALQPVAAHAAQASITAADTILHALQGATASWGAAAATIGTELFVGLAVISFALSLGYTVMQEGGFNPLALGALIIRQAVFMGFWIWMLQNWAGNFGAAIIKSFQQSAFEMGGVAVSPAAVVEQGGNIAATLFNQTSLIHPGTAVGLSICAVLIYVLFLFTAFLMLLGLGKAYIAILIGGIAMGFAGFPETRNLAYNAIFMTIAAGARLFMIQLLAGLGGAILNGLAGAGPIGQDSVWPILGLAFLWACCSFTLPALAEHMFGGAGHARAGAGPLIAATSSAVSTGAGLATGQSMSAAAAIGSAGRSMFASLGGGGSGGGGSSGGSGRLPSGSGVGVSAAAAGSRMRPAGARYTPGGP